MYESVKIFSSKEELAIKFCEEFFFLSERYRERKKFFNVALSGGKTPEIIFQTLADIYANKINWKNVRFFWGDERCVPPDDPESNYGMTKKFFLDRINIPPENVYRIFGENNPIDETLRYQEQFLKLFYDDITNAKFELTMLGLGDDGHTASIFPNSLQLLSAQELFAVAEHPVTKQKRITATRRLINNSEKIIFLVTGENKSSVLREIIGRQNNYLEYPAAYIEPTSGTLEWYVDESAASLLNNK
ncbi:MAG: 6-phosphogluconolactonase [Bacteroidetes bacterium]|nr:6-phosphogluconolactonase [Bacteroidota bacterium]